jgi:hypothetical protein
MLLSTEHSENEIFMGIHCVALGNRLFSLEDTSLDKFIW